MHTYTTMRGEGLQKWLLCADLDTSLNSYKNQNFEIDSTLSLTPWSRKVANITFMLILDIECNS